MSVSDDQKNCSGRKREPPDFSGANPMKKYHEVRNVRFEKYYLLMRVDSKDYRIDVRPCSKKLPVRMKSQR